MAGAARAEPAIFKDADLKLGAELIGTHRCAECHVRRVGGDGSAMYRPLGRFNTPGFLRGMVEQCNSQLNLGLFPEEVTAVAAVLNQDHYRFAKSEWRRSRRRTLGALAKAQLHACHGMDRKLVGPSFVDIARQHLCKVDDLASRIQGGGMGVWGPIPMPAQALSETDARTIAQWLAKGAGK